MIWQTLRHHHAGPAADCRHPPTHTFLITWVGCDASQRVLSLALSLSLASPRGEGRARVRKARRDGARGPQTRGRARRASRDVTVIQRGNSGEARRKLYKSYGGRGPMPEPSTVISAREKPAGVRGEKERKICSKATTVPPRLCGFAPFCWRTT
jgi:hypothetical protein